MGLSWALAGAVAGFAIEIFHNVFPTDLGASVDIWPAAFAYPGFFGGILFSVVLGIAGRNRRFEDLSLAKFATWGGLGGLLLAFVPVVMVGLGLASTNVSLWSITAALAIPFTLGGAVAASGTLWLARLAEESTGVGSGERPALPRSDVHGPDRAPLEG